MSQKIKSKMVLAGVSQTDIAVSLGIKPSTVSAVINGHRKSKRVQRAVAEVLQVPFESLWGKAA